MRKLSVTNTVGCDNLSKIPGTVLVSLITNFVHFTNMVTFLIIGLLFFMMY